MKSLLIFLLIMGFTNGIFANKALTQKKNKDKLSFFVLGDWGRDGKDHQTDVAEQMERTAQTVHPKFILTAGDNFYDEGIKDVHARPFTTSYTQVYTGKDLQIPWYVCLGNHDYLGSENAEIAYSKVNSHWHLPARYYTFQKKINNRNAVRFIVIDSSPFIKSYYQQSKYHDVIGQDTLRQKEWIDSVLSRNKGECNINCVS